MNTMNYLKFFRKFIKNIPYLYKEELLFKNHLEVGTKERHFDSEFYNSGMKVLVVSKIFMRNFGDRLGYHNVTMLTSLIPNVTCVDFDDPEVLEKNPADYDLVIIGTGNSIYHNMISEKFYDYLSKANHVVGICGFQYYEMLEKNKDLFEKCINQFDKIFIRYEKDIHFLKKLNISTEHVTHLGDWLIMLFPITSWNKDETLYITHKEPFIRNALDLYIQDIQTYRHVHSNRLHTLLCAFCSAEKVSYGEQFDKRKNIYSGKFEGLLKDVFGETYQPNEYFVVNKQSVLNYRNKVSNNFLTLVDYIKSI